MEAWIGLIGALLGIVVGAAVTVGVDIARRRHEDRHRFADTKRSLYGEFYRLTQDVGLELVGRMHELYDVVEGRRSPRNIRPVASVLPVLDLEQQLMTVAPDDVHAAAVRLRDAMFAIQQVAMVDPAGLSESPWNRGDASAMWRAHDEFITLARRDLGIGRRTISND